MTKKLFSEGAESLLYRVRMLGYEVVVKERQAKAYRAGALDTELRRSRTRREARILERLNAAGVRVPLLLAVGTYALYMERIDGRMLKDMPRIPSRALRDAGTALGAMHRADVAHGDFTPANIMLSGPDVVIIDFGLSEVTNSLEEKALDLLLMKRSVTKQQYQAFARSYHSSYAKAKEVSRRLESIERRGRYQTRTLA